MLYLVCLNDFYNPKISPKGAGLTGITSASVNYGTDFDSAGLACLSHYCLHYLRFLIILICVECKFVCRQGNLFETIINWLHSQANLWMSTILVLSSFISGGIHILVCEFLKLLLCSFSGFSCAMCFRSRTFDIKNFMLDIRNKWFIKILNSSSLSKFFIDILLMLYFVEKMNLFQADA